MESVFGSKSTQAFIQKYPTLGIDVSFNNRLLRINVIDNQIYSSNLIRIIMRKSNTIFSLLTAFLAVSLSFTSCEKNDPDPTNGEPEDVNIPIDDNSVFNMKNFVKSFDQLFVADNRWAWDFTHDYNDGKVEESHQNYKIFGEFGAGIFTINHTYNADGVIISSERRAQSNEVDDGAVLTFEYDFDLEGYIIEHKKYVNDKLRDIVVLDYDDDGMLIKKTHQPIESDDTEWDESFTYNSDGLVIKYQNNRWDAHYEYTYSNGNMVKEKRFEDGVIERVSNYEYDSSGRMVKESPEGEDWYVIVEYSNDIMSFLQYENNLLTYRTDYGVGYNYNNSFDYNYDSNGNFEYCLSKEDDADGYTKKKYYYEGTIDNLQLVGYTVIDSREGGEYNKKTKESVYNSSDTKLYYAEFTVYNGDITETNWFTANGSPINASDISEEWVFILIK